MNAIDVLKLALEMLETAWVGDYDGVASQQATLAHDTSITILQNAIDEVAKIELIKQQRDYLIEAILEIQSYDDQHRFTCAEVLAKVGYGETEAE